MTIREVERRSGLERTNIRFYEKEGLLSPTRRENGYRDYSQEDLQLLLKIKLLRRLGFSLDAVRALKDGSADLEQALARRLETIGVQRRELAASEQVCLEMRQEGADFPTLDAQRYLTRYDQALHTAGAAVRLSPTVPASDRVQPVRCPWRRFFARTLDSALVSLLLWTVLALVFRVNIARVPGLVDWLLGLVQWGVLIPAEGLLLSKWGTTPGKWIMGIRMEHVDGRRLTFGEAAGRAWRIFTRGMGWTIPIYNLYRLWRSYRAVKETGEAEWDWEWNSLLVVPEREARPWRGAAFAGAYLLVLAVTVIVTQLPGFAPPNRGTLTAEEFVENCHYFARYYDLDAYVLPPEGDAVPVEGTMFSGFSVGTLKLELQEGDGRITGISYTQSTTDPLQGILADTAEKQAFLLAVMAYAWADSGPLAALRHRQELTPFLRLQEGTLQQELWGCRLTYSITPWEDPSGENGTRTVFFEIVPLADP